MQPADLTACTELLSAQESLFQPRKPQSDIGQPLTAQAAFLSNEMALGFFCSLLAMSFSLMQSPSPLLRHRPLGQLAEAGPEGAWLLSAVVRGTVPSCFAREPWLTCWAACPRRGI